MTSILDMMKMGYIDPFLFAASRDLQRDIKSYSVGEVDGVSIRCIARRTA